VLDIEKVLVDTLESKKSDEYVRLTTYELLVSGIDHKPTLVHAFIHAVINQRFNEPSFKEYTVKWKVEKGTYEIEEHCLDLEKENVSRKDPLKSTTDPFINMILSDFIASQKQSPIYCLDNMQFVECQLTLDQLDSPVDTVSISLAHSCTMTR
jgi:hypothetical protein